MKRGFPGVSKTELQGMRTARLTCGEHGAGVAQAGIRRHRIHMGSKLQGRHAMSSKQVQGQEQAGIRWQSIR